MAHAVSEADDDAASVVQKKVDNDNAVVRMADDLRREAESRVEAEKRVEMIRNLPPDRIPDWVDGKLSEEDLVRLASTPQGSQQEQEPTVVAGVLGENRNNLLLAGLAAVVFGCLYVRQRLRERLDELKGEGGGR